MVANGISGSQDGGRKELTKEILATPHSGVDGSTIGFGKEP